MSKPSPDDLTRMIVGLLAKRARCPEEYFAPEPICADVVAALAENKEARHRLDVLLNGAPTFLLDAYRAAQGQQRVLSLEEALHDLQATQALPARVAYPILRAIEAQSLPEPHSQGILKLALPGGKTRCLRTLDDLRDELRQPWTGDPRSGCRLALIPGFGKNRYTLARKSLGMSTDT
jgi:hypothetical protein